MKNGTSETNSIVELNCDFAKAFRKIATISCEREIKQKRALYLRKEIEEGRFHTPEWATAVCGGVKYRINGNSTSHVICELYSENPNHPALKGLKVFLREFQCSTMDDVVTRWTSFDSTESVRSIGQCRDAIVGEIEGFEGCTSTMNGRIMSGLGLKFFGTSQRSRPLDERYALLKSDEALNVWNFIQNLKIWCGDDPERIKMMDKVTRSSVVAVIAQTISIDEVRAFKFWTDLISGENHNTKSPTRVLAFFLSNTASRGGSTTRGDSASDKEFICRLWRGWEYWCDNPNMDYKPFPHKGAGSFVDDEKNVPLPSWVGSKKYAQKAK